MADCGANLSKFKDHDNIAIPHARFNRVSTLIEAELGFGEQTVASAAGGIYCSTASYMKWHDM